MDNNTNAQERTEFENRLLSIEKRLCQLEYVILHPLGEKKRVEVNHEN